MKALASNLFSGMLDLVYPSYCLACGRADDDYLCAECIEMIDVVGDMYCHKCAMPCEANICADCQNREFSFDFAGSAGLYEGVLRKAIHALKYDMHLAIVEQLADLMIRCYPHRQLNGNVDMVVPIPIHRNRLVERGFNQSEELGRLLCKRISVPLEINALYRIKNTRHQVSLPQDERMLNIKGAFAVQRPDLITGKRVLLVDDVFTTGSTLNEAAKMLKEAGAQSVFVYTLARSF
ncbi:MAG: ComF family protein [Armatimonadota bacterium]